MSSRLFDVLLGLIPAVAILPFITNVFGIFGAVKKTYRATANAVKLSALPGGKNVNLTVKITTTVGGVAISNAVLNIGFVNATTDPISSSLAAESVSAAANTTLIIHRTFVLPSDLTEDWRTKGEGKYLKVDLSGATINEVEATFWS